VCTESETVELRVQVMQRATGAVAEGRTRLTCTGAPRHWDINAAIQGNETFREGSATAVAFGRTTTRGAPTDAHQWVVNITLAGEQSLRIRAIEPDKPPGFPIVTAKLCTVVRVNCSAL
jgi:hypothetical protein